MARQRDVVACRGSVVAADCAMKKATYERGRNKHIGNYNFFYKKQIQQFLFLLFLKLKFIFQNFFFFKRFFKITLQILKIGF